MSGSGTCVDQVNSYRCDCPQNFFGQDCESIHTCLDTADDDATDLIGDTCDDYRGWEDTTYCTERNPLDDDDFKAKEMCCACGGGTGTSSPSTPTPRPSPSPSPSPSRTPSRETCLDTADDDATDKYGDSCAWYEYGDRYELCEFFDDNDFTASRMCCVCGGGTRDGAPSRGDDGAPSRGDEDVP